MSRIESWFCIDSKIRQELDPILSDYEIARRNGLSPRRDRFLARCSNESVREVLEQELDYYDQFFEECHRHPGDQNVLQEKFADAIPDSIDEYRIIKHIGEGSFADVFLAYDCAKNFRVALKIAEARHLNKEKRICFEREIEALQLVDHHRIVKYLNSFEHKDLYVCVTEWIDGVTLHDALRAGPLPQKEMVNWLIEIAEGLHFIHQKGIIHRDVKPHNVMIDRGAHARILDFGLARILNSDSSDRSIRGQLKGSICYMSPEQTRGETETLDARSDVFSLGVVMYEALTGKRPFDNQPKIALAQIQTYDPPGICEIRPDLPVGLERICRRAMAKLPNQRYQTAQQMQYDLVAFQHDRLITLPRRETPSKSQTTRPRFSKLWLALPALMIACGLWMTGTMWPTGNSNLPAAASSDPNPVSVVPLDDGSSIPGSVEIVLNTFPGLASVAFVPLDERGQPEIGSTIQAGVSPIHRWLSPGNYLVVAQLPDGQFTEVIRHVPFAGERNQTVPSWSWREKGTAVELPRIKIDSPDKSTMRLAGDVWIDVSEVNIDKAPKPMFHKGRRPPPGEKFSRLVAIEALWYLESDGKRLPFHAELQAAIRNGVIQDDDSKPEWTMDVKLTKFAIDQSLGKNSVCLTTFRCYSAEELDQPITVISRCAFRGARRDRPLVIPARNQKSRPISAVH